MDLTSISILGSSRNAQHAAGVDIDIYQIGHQNLLPLQARDHARMCGHVGNRR